jgi:FdhD protein
VKAWQDPVFRSVDDSLAAAEPLEIRIIGVPLSVTIGTPGHVPELAAGFLIREVIVRGPGHIADLPMATPSKGPKSNAVEVKLNGAAFDAEHLERNFFAASSCGICGKASIDAVRLPGLRQPDRGFRISPQMLCHMAELLRSEQAVLTTTGGLDATMP